MEKLLEKVWRYAPTEGNQNALKTAKKKKKKKENNIRAKKGKHDKILHLPGNCIILI